MAIMTCFFFIKNSYGIGKKAHIFCFFFLICSKIVIIIYFILAITIKNLVLR